MTSGSWRWAVMLVVVMSMVGATAVLAQKAPRSQESTPDLAPGQVTPLAVETFESKVTHLHFMLIDGKAPLTSNALPFEIDAFHTRGVMTNYDAFLAGAVAQISPEQQGKHRDRLPLHRTVNEFR